MVNRRSVIALGATMPFLFQRFDTSDWAKNTEAGIDHPTDLGFFTLMPLQSWGPYLRFAWLDLPQGEALPVVRGMFWITQHDLHQAGDTLRLGANFGGGWQQHEVAIDPGLSTDTMVEKEAVLRAIRLMIREHAGVETHFMAF